MKSIKKYKILLILSLFVIFSCDDIKNPLKEKSNTTCGDETSPVPIKKILVEDYTGHTCNNCPLAAEAILALKADYCDHVIPVAMHVSLFAKPNSQYPADYRTTDGTAYDNYFKVSNTGLPNGLVNRKKVSSNFVLPWTSWATAIAALLTQSAEIDIKISNTYSSATRSVKIQINSEFLKATSDSLSLSVYFLEDSIVSPQADKREPTGKIEKYTHRHMFRSTVNSTWGEAITTTGFAFGAIYSKEYTFQVDPAWNEKHGEIVAFIFKTNSKEVIQAESEHLIK